jgi:aquaporin Z
MKDSKQLVKSLVAELVGTFFLTLAALIGGNPYVVGVTLGVFVYAIGAISGSNLNPAVTLGLLVSRRLPLLTTIFYIVAQVAGALLALLAANFTGHLAAHYASASPLEEFLGFGLLMLTVVAVSDKNVPEAGSGIAIGGALAAGLVFSRGILNPAVAIAMGQALSPAVWATLISAVLFSLLYQLYKSKDKATGEDQQAKQDKQDAFQPGQLRSVPKAR